MRTGRAERVSVNLEAVYPKDSEEYSFEEIIAAQRGWMSRDWKKERRDMVRSTAADVEPIHPIHKSVEKTEVENLTQTFHDKLDLQNTSSQNSTDASRSKATKQKKIKHREVKQETQTGKVHKVI